MPNPYNPKRSVETVAEIDGKKYIRESNEKNIRVTEEEKKKDSLISTFFKLISNIISGKKGAN